MDSTLYSLYIAYIPQLKKVDLANLNTSLIKYFLPAFGFKPYSTTRRTPEDTTNALEKMKTISLSEFQNAREIQKTIFDKLKINPIRQKQPRSYLNKMLSWATANGFFASSLPKYEPKEQPLLRRSRDRQKFLRTKLTDRSKLRAYALMTISGDYINQFLETQLVDFKSFCLDELNLKDSTWEKQLQITKQLLGFWHRELNVPLESLCLFSIVPFVKLNYSISDFGDNYINYCVAKIRAEDKIKADSKVLIDNLKALWGYLKKLQSLKSLSFEYQKSYISALVNITKFIYKDETDVDASNDYTDIYLIRRLHTYSNKLNATSDKAPVVPIENKTVPWTTVIKVLESSRQDCLQTTYTCEKQVIQRPVEAIARSLQTFLMLGFLVLIPPDRQQILRSICFVEDLNPITPRERKNYILHGLFEEDKFIPRSKLSNPEKALWYLYLSEYKTSKTYGVMIGTLPNTQFPDGTTFYQYIERWLYPNPITFPMGTQVYNLRHVLAPLTDKCFMQPRAKKALTSATVYKIITCLFQSLTGVQVNPHTLRHIFSTYLDELESRNEITPYERECLALWMKHSLDMQRKTYNHTKTQDKVNLGSKAMERINNLL